MENIIIIPENEKQSSVIKAFLKEMKIRFKTNEDDTLLSKEAFHAKIDEAVKEAEDGKGTLVKNKEELKSYLDSL